MVFSALVSQSQFRLYSFYCSPSPYRWGSMLPALLRRRHPRPGAPACHSLGRKTRSTNIFLLRRKAHQEQTHLAIPRTTPTAKGMDISMDITEMGMMVVT